MKNLDENYILEQIAENYQTNTFVMVQCHSQANLIGPYGLFKTLKSDYCRLQAHFLPMT